MASVDAQIKKQVEFYFSDSNFRRDKFLQAEAKKNDDGFVPFRVLFTFKKLAELTTDGAVLQAALAGSDVVELNATNDAVKRRHPLPEVDDAPQRTLVLAGLGTNSPTIDEIKAAFAAVDADPLFIQRKIFRKRFSGVVNVELATVAELERVAAVADKLSILGHTPSVLSLAAFQQLSDDEKREFEKAYAAMLVAKNVPLKPVATYEEELLPFWEANAALRPRVKLAEDTATLYLVFTQVAFAEQMLAAITDSGFTVDDTKLAFELVTDKDAIAARPRSGGRKDNKRKREVEGKTIHISNIGSRVRLDDIKKLLATVMAADARSPYIEYEGMDRASFTISNAADATALFEKLAALEGAELGGKKVAFHLLEPNEPLQVELQYEKGLIVAFAGVEAEISRDDIKDAVNTKLGDKAAEGSGVAFIKYQLGDKSGYLRVTSAELAKDVVDAITNGGVEVNGFTINQAHLVDGDEEKQFWVDAHDARVNRFKAARTNKNQQFGGRGGGRGGRGGRGGGRGRRN